MRNLLRNFASNKKKECYDPKINIGRKEQGDG